MKMTMQPTASANVSLQSLFEKFILFKLVRNLSEESISYYRNCYSFFAGFFGEERALSDFTQDLYYQYILYLKQTRPNLKDVTLNSYLRGLRVILYYAMDLGLLPRIKLDMMKADKEIKETYTDEELTLLLKKPDTKNCGFHEYRNWVIVNYLLATGNRASTVINILISDLDLSVGMVRLTKTKNRKQMIVPLSQTMVKILQEYLAYRQGKPEDYLFYNQFGKQFTRDGLQTAVMTYNRNRGVHKTSIHLFRHTFAKKWILSGGDIFRLQKLLGHSSLDVVKEYVNIFGADLKAQYDTYNPLESMYRSQNLEAKTALSMKRK